MNPPMTNQDQAMKAIIKYRESQNFISDFKNFFAASKGSTRTIFSRVSVSLCK